MPHCKSSLRPTSRRQTRMRCACFPPLLFRPCPDLPCPDLPCPDLPCSDLPRPDLPIGGDHSHRGRAEQPAKPLAALAICMKYGHPDCGKTRGAAPTMDRTVAGEAPFAVLLRGASSPDCAIDGFCSAPAIRS